ncbi:MAG: 6-bladed beta-propeller [Bacteroidales bacterium]|nr:6-bladed beta-propeller [Bacteroidales bacterium]
MRRYRILTVFIACIAMSSLCSCKSEVDHEKVITVNLAEVNKKRVINLSDWVSVPEFIALDSSSEDAYTEGGNCCVSDNYIGLYGSSQVYKLYDRKTGKYLRNIGRIGKNSGEYTNVYRSEINEENSMVYILPWTAKELLCYDLNTGDLIEARQLKYNVPKGAFVIDPETDELTIATLPFEGENETVVWKQDKEDNTLWEVSAGDLSLVRDYSHAIGGAFNTEDFDFSISTWGGRVDSLYVVKDGFLKPIFTMNFMKSNKKNSSSVLPNHTYTLLPEHIITSVSMPVRRASGYYSYGKPVYVVTERGMEHSYVAEFTDDILNRKLEYLPFTQGYYKEVFSAEDFMKIGKAALSKGKLSETSKARISDILKDITPESNNVILLAPLKR